LSKTSFYDDKNGIEKFQESYLDKSFCESKPNYVSSYLENIYERDKLSEDYSIYFPQVLFGKPDLIDLIFDKISAILGDEIGKTPNFPIKVGIKQDYKDTDPIFQSPGYGSDFTFLIRNKNEYTYAANLNLLYKKLIKPFLDKNNQSLSHVSELFRRFYYFTEPLKGAGYLGKTMGNPDRATFVSPHYSNNYFTTFTTENYLSHFRNRISLKRGEVSITNMHIDFNYFLCYFIPIYENIIKNKNDVN
jgi:hypothetical protein